MTTGIVEKWNRLLDVFAPINAAHTHAPTILEIAGYPHYENVCSNILAFFLDPTKEHGLKDLALSSLLECAGQQMALSNVSVEREVFTGNGRIDLLIAADEGVVAIENKIFHAVVNDFADYGQYVKSLPGSRPSVLVILSPYDAGSTNHAGFTCVTYGQYFAAIRKNIGPYLLGADHKFLMFLLDFIQSIEHLIAGGSMHQDLRTFFHEHQQQVRDLLNAWNNVRTELRNKVKELDGLVGITDPNGIAIKKYLFRESQELLDILVHDITVEYPIAVDCWITMDGWRITIFDRDTGNMDKVRQLLDASDLQYDVNTDNRYELKFHADYDTPIDQVATQLSDVLSKMLNQLARTLQPV